MEKKGEAQHVFVLVIFNGFFFIWVFLDCSKFFGQRAKMFQRAELLPFVEAKKMEERRKTELIYSLPSLDESL